MAEQQDIVILNAEARRRGTSYGKLVSTLSREETREILHRAARVRAAKGKRTKEPPR